MLYFRFEQITVNLKQLNLHYECTSTCDFFSKRHVTWSAHMLMVWFLKKKSCVRGLNGIYDMISSRYCKV